MLLIPAPHNQDTPLHPPPHPHTSPPLPPPQPLHPSPILPIPISTPFPNPSPPFLTPAEHHFKGRMAVRTCRQSRVWCLQWGKEGEGKGRGRGRGKGQGKAGTYICTDSNPRCWEGWGNRYFGGGIWGELGI